MTKHPGQSLHEDFMKPLEISANQLAKNLGLNRSTVGRLIAGRQRLTPEMAARLGAYFGVPARWWLLMQAEFDAGEIAKHTELREGVTPLDVSPNILLTPTGVLVLDAPEVAQPEPPPSISREALERLPQGSLPERRKVRVIRYENGSVALVGDTT